MLPHISHQNHLPPLYNDFISSLKNKNFTGDINASYSARLSVATDNSIYQQLPQLVIQPRTQSDIVLLATTASNEQYLSIKFSARGGGTGTNGQSLTPGVVVDLSKYMNKVLEINVEEKWVRVEAGVVKDQLNDFLRPHGFFFAPDLSTSNRATVGGMINTDASGQGSLVYGKTSNHVLALTSVLANGEVLNTEPMTLAQAQNLAQKSTVEGESQTQTHTISHSTSHATSHARIMAQVLDSCIENRELVLKTFPRLNRFLTGYDLENVLKTNDDGDIIGVDLSRLITGSEGSLAFVCEAKLNINPIRVAKTLINIKYDSFDSALRHSPSLVEAKATSVETIDSRVLNLAKQDIVWHSVSDLITDVPGKVMDGINVVEYNGDSIEGLAAQVAQLTSGLDVLISKDGSLDKSSESRGVIGYQVTSDLASINKIYAMRKKAVGLLGKTEGSQKPLAFAEDTAVPPENLADFIGEFRALLDGYELNYGMFGHVDAGVLHVRPALDMCDPEQEKLLRTISDKVVKLTAKYGGLMWGEHGKGYRSEYGPEFFGEHLFNELRKIKAAFDPLNRMNPGKICTPFDSSEQLVSVDDTKRGFYDRQIPVTVKESFTAAMDCNGNGLCFNYDADSPMCPSSKITRDRRHSPKGRAGLMREWLRLLEKQGVDILKLEDNINTSKSIWSVKEILTNAADKLRLNFISKPQQDENGNGDFSHEVMEAMQGCLACKACASQCPIKVDVPDFRSRFINIYYSRYARPLKDHLVANVEILAPLMAKAPKIVNAVLNTKLYDKLSAKTIGYVNTPLLSVPTLKKQVKKAGFSGFDLTKLQRLTTQQRKGYVLIVQDPFTSFYDATTVESMMSLIKKLGLEPILLPFKPNGKAQHVKGFLARFAKTAKSSSDFLNQLAALDIPMLGMDASMVLCYRDEYAKTLQEKRGDFSVLLAHEWLLTFIKEDTAFKGAFSSTEHSKAQAFKLFSHCTEKTALVNSENEWQSIFEHFGLALEKVSVGCCGMAGTYGHEKTNLDNSKGLFELSWQAKLETLASEQVLATGFSCRSQVKRFSDLKARHPVAAILDSLS
ncbi:D-2-hydroxyglutarate dehydrogenase YdiJ [Colwellia psychrerythraea]|uniref:D-2-hydroxyglutarate dehydrogenase n=1 Tax=Colwellia psychrerythraea (strain 34H / ATCC BAA-681) TaxID=167879 RepID=Q47ZS2_COLP3|nr:FAD-binding and (Fe-S)-binding domain-containing protein [Colwellia psychrerythraea]AAZ25079.1 FAD binding protein [Colwellia psychrerythraea 34H]